MTATATKPPATTAAAPPQTGYLYGLDALRVIGAAIIVYTHLGQWIVAKRERWPVGDFINTVTAPVHIRPDLDFIGVALFLLVSGVVTTKVSFREQPLDFLRRRAVRIMPPLWAALVIAYFIVGTGLVPEMTPQEAATVPQLLNNLWFGAYFVPGGMILLPAIWTLLIQMVYFTYTGLTIPLLRRWPWLPSALAATVITTVISLVPQTYSSALRTVVSFIPMIFIGQLISLAHTKKIRFDVAVLLGAIHLVLFIRADVVSKGIFRPGGGFEICLLVMIGVVLVCMTANGPIARSAFVKSVSKRTYSVYLMHLPVCFAAMTLLDKVIGTSWAALVAIVSVVVATELFYRLVEGPLERWLGKRSRRKRTADTHGKMA
jgi:peptidoglycan/LPS O-acetylase OafA/YrhL